MINLHLSMKTCIFGYQIMALDTEKTLVMLFINAFPHHHFLYFSTLKKKTSMRRRLRFSVTSWRRYGAGVLWMICGEWWWCDGVCKCFSWSCACALSCAIRLRPELSLQKEQWLNWKNPSMTWKVRTFYFNRLQY